MKLSRSLLAVPALALAMSFGAVPPKEVHAQSKCGSAAKVGAAIFEKYNAEIKKVGCKKGGEKCAKIEEVVREMIKFWNEMSANSWATIGPREIVFEGKLDGKVVAGGERVFLTKTPVLDADEVTVEVKKEGGKAPAEISLSTIDEEGRCIEGSDVSFDDDAKNGSKKTFSLKGIRNRIVVIKVDAKKGKAFDYELVVRKK
jgi:hypothetical protein